MVTSLLNRRGLKFEDLALKISEISGDLVLIRMTYLYAALYESENTPIYYDAKEILEIPVPLETTSISHICAVKAGEMWRVKTQFSLRCSENEQLWVGDQFDDSF